MTAAPRDGLRSRPDHWTFPRQVIFNGATAGLVYGVLAVGMVLIYRSSRVINFAYGEIGALAATLMARLVFHWGWNFFPSLLVVLVVGALLSAVIELRVVRRLFTRRGSSCSSRRSA